MLDRIKLPAREHVLQIYVRRDNDGDPCGSVLTVTDDRTRFNVWWIARDGTLQHVVHHLRRGTTMADAQDAAARAERTFWKHVAETRSLFDGGD